MTTSLQSALSQVSEDFAQKVFDVIRTAFMAELSSLALPGGAPPRVASPTPAIVITPAPKAKPGPKPKTTAKVAPKAAPKAGRLERRSSESIKQALDGIAALLAQRSGIGSEEIQKTLGLARNEIARPISIGLASGVLRKTGAKRATKYFVGNGAKKAAKTPKAAKRAGNAEAAASGAA